MFMRQPLNKALYIYIKIVHGKRWHNMCDLKRFLYAMGYVEYIKIILLHIL